MCLTYDERSGIILVINKEGEMLMTTDTETSKDEAIAFLLSTRGQYIVSQALHYAIKSLESVEPEIMQEKSNIDDMKYLQESLFTFPAILFDVEAQKEKFAQLKDQKETSI